MGPPASICRASRCASGRGTSACTGAPIWNRVPFRAAFGCQDQVKAAQDHRQGQPLSHVQAGAFCKFHQLRICLAEEFDREACKAVAKQEYADELAGLIRSEEHTSELQSLMRIAYA